MGKIINIHWSSLMYTRLLSTAGLINISIYNHLNTAQYECELFNAKVMQVDWLISYQFSKLIFMRCSQHIEIRPERVNAQNWWPLSERFVPRTFPCRPVPAPYRLRARSWCPRGWSPVARVSWIPGPEELERLHQGGQPYHPVSDPVRFVYLWGRRCDD